MLKVYGPPAPLVFRYGDKVESITVTGHSLGGALASICAFDLAYSEINQVGAKPDGALIPVTAITFCGAAVGAPKVFLISY